MASFRILLTLVTIFENAVSIYDPSDQITTKSTSYRNIGVKSIKWQDDGSSNNGNNIQIHHNYSRVSFNRGNNQNSEQYQRNSTSTDSPSNANKIVRKRRIEIYSKCPKHATGQFVYELSCYQFLNCWKGRGFVQNCPPGTLFNPKSLECDHMQKVNCVSGNRRSVLYRHRQEINDKTQARCPEEFSGLIPHYGNCTKFINCVNGAETVLNCPPGTIFDVNTNTCNHPQNAQCVKSGNNIQFENYQTEVNEDSRFHNGFTSNLNKDTIQLRGSYNRPEYVEQNRRSYQTSYGSSQQKLPDFNPQCPPGAVGVHPHPHDCSKFLNCANGITYIQNCGPGTLFNPTIKVCDFPYNVRCNVQETTPYPTREEQIHGSLDWGNDQNGNKRPTGEKNFDFEDLDQGGQETKNVGHSWLENTTPKWSHQNKGLNVEYEYDDDIILDPKPTTEKLPTDCGHQYSCMNSQQCIAHNRVCDDVADCQQGEDERNCTLDTFNKNFYAKLNVIAVQIIIKTTPTSCAKYCAEIKNFTCKSFNFRRQQSTCYLLDKNVAASGPLISSIHNDYYEKNAPDCTSSFKCSSGKCLLHGQICDGVNDCEDRIDEKNCDPQKMGYGIRLVGSDKNNEGRILVTAYGLTGFVCDDKFGLRDANVVCKELGYEFGALEVKGNSHFSSGLKKDNIVFLMDDVSCFGNETSLKDCDFSGWGVHKCTHQEVVGVICKTPEEKCQEDFWKCDTKNQCVHKFWLCDGVEDCDDSSDENDAYCQAPVELRLVNGSSSKEGRVEVRYHGTWGTICDDDFSDNNAKVICRYLGYPGTVSIRKEAFFGPGKGPIWLDDVKCQGNESTIQECIFAGWGQHNCEHSEDVGLICSDFDTSGSERHSKSTQENIPVPLAVPSTSCGYRKDNQFLIDDEIHFRVVKGATARKGDYPWQASLRVKNLLQKTHWCGAVVVSSKFVLTAAHCLFKFDKSSFVVVAGDYNIDTVEGTEQESYIEDFYIHEDFRKGQKMNNDIALVKLKGNGFKLTEDVQPICLVDADTKYNKNMNCTISGFGSIRSGQSAFSHDLKAGWIPIQPQEICKMPHVYGDSITEGMICAGSLDEGVDACDGDSGGPLACLNQGLFTLYGLTSWGHHCGYANKPGVYVKIAHYRTWIDDTIKKHS